MEEIILHRYLTGDASEEEVQSVFNWMKESGENRNQIIQLKQTWALTASADEDKEKAWDKVRVHLKRETQKKTLWNSYYRYVAIAIILVSIGAISQRLMLNERVPQSIYTHSTSFEVPQGQISSVILPDSTYVYLNSESKLSFSDNFINGNRVVNLTGEGYFKVKSDKDHPFVVKTPGRVHVKVFGTSFNLRAYADENKIFTTLEEGRVSIIDNNGNELAKLKPGEKASYSNDDNMFKVDKVRTELFSSWKDGMITFRNESLGNISRMMQRWYHVEIIIEDPNLAKELYNGTIMKNKPVDQILEVLKETSSIKYEIIPRTDKPTLIYWR